MGEDIKTLEHYRVNIDSPIAVLDLDAVKYSVASVGESRTINVIHKSSGREKEFNNRTEFWGRGKKVGGWLGEQNEVRLEKGLEPFSPDDFEIQDKQTVTEPLQNVLHSAKLTVESALTSLGTKKYQAFLGKGESFRVEKSTLLKYKSGREKDLRPLLLDDVTEYLAKKFNAEIVTGIECDDRVTMETYKQPNKVIVGVDKDFYGCGGNFFNMNKPEEGIIKTDVFGTLYRDNKKKIRGCGRMFKLFQACSQDDSDTYKANCMSDVKWGEVSAFNALCNATNDKELFQSAAEVFKKLYPEPKIITGWRGNEIEIDWLYVFQEMMNMCHMLRFEGDEVNVKDVLDKLGVDY